MIRRLMTTRRYWIGMIKGGRRLLGGVIGLLLLVGSGVTVSVQAQTAWQSDATYAFGQEMRFRLAGEVAGEVERVTLFFRAPEFPQTFSESIPFVVEDGVVTADYRVDLSRVQLAPFTDVSYWWTLTYANGNREETRRQSFIYEDDQFTWQEAETEGATVHWTGDDPALGQLALDIVAEARPHLQSFLPAAADAPFTIYIYPTSADLRAALRLTGRDWVGAHAHPELGVLLVTAVNPRTAPADLRQSIPHEMLHALLYRATIPYYDALPAWFNEGLATLVEMAPAPGYQAILETAVAEQTAIPFSELCHRFPAATDGALLAYAQSASLIRYVQTQYGDHTVRQMIAAFADGADCETAVQRTMNLSLAELNREWLRNQQPRSPLAQFWASNSLWLLLIAGGFVISGLLVLAPRRASRNAS